MGKGGGEHELDVDVFHDWVCQSKRREGGGNRYLICTRRTQRKAKTADEGMIGGDGKENGKGCAEELEWGGGENRREKLESWKVRGAKV